MNAVDTAKNLMKSAAEASLKKAREIYIEYGGEPDPPGPVSVTILAQPKDIRSIWTDSTQLSKVLGDVATVTRTANGEFTWTAPRLTGDIDWTTTLIDHPAENDPANDNPANDNPVSDDAVTDDVEHTVRFVLTDTVTTDTIATSDTVDSADAGADVVLLRLSPAPNDMGTQASLQLNLPIPDFVAKTTAFTLLYRTRALLQTGEIPTLRPLPAARPNNR